MMLSTPLEKTFFLLFVDTLAKVIEENPVKAFNFSALVCLWAICCVRGPPGATEIS